MLNAPLIDVLPPHVPEPPLGTTFDPDGIDLRPHSAYEAITRQLVDGLREDVGDIKSRLNGLIFTIAGAVLLEVASRMLGG